MCCPTSPINGEVEELRDLLETSNILDNDDDFDDDEEEHDDEAAGHYVCEECDGCHATNEYLLECLNHVLQKVFASDCCIMICIHLSQCGEEKMEHGEWMNMAVPAKMQVTPPLLYFPN